MEGQESLVLIIQKEDLDETEVVEMQEMKEGAEEDDTMTEVVEETAMVDVVDGKSTIL